MAESTAAEEWRPVVGFEGHYEVSNLGRVRSLDRPIPVRRPGAVTHYRPIRGRMIRLCLDTRGYLVLGLSKDGVRITGIVHLLVLEAFVGPPPPGHECRHLNGVKTDARLVNLRWGTRSENAFDRTTHHTNPQVIKTHCPLGHVLAAPNLRKDTSKRGHRGCLACKQASRRISQLRHIGGLNLNRRAMADRYYADIMAKYAA